MRIEAEDTEKEIEVLEGCMCEYIPNDLRDQIDILAGKTDAYAAQVVTVALQIGLGVLLGQTSGLMSSTSVSHGGGKIKNSKGKLSGKGIS